MKKAFNHMPSMNGNDDGDYADLGAFENFDKFMVKEVGVDVL